MYHAVVLAYGASNDRNLGIPGEDLHGCLSARSFVAWYNGHPSYSDLKIDLTNVESAVVIGNGNVALDVARILLSPIERLEKTDIADAALEELSRSRVRQVHVVGRRGASQSAWSTAELREVASIPGCSVVMRPEEVALDAVDEESVAKTRAKKRGMALLSDILARAHEGGAAGAGKELHLRFLLSPKVPRLPMASPPIPCAGGESGGPLGAPQELSRCLPPARLQQARRGGGAG